MISFIVPAHNEQYCLGKTLQAINDAAAVIGQPCELMVVNDASTDATAEVARQHHATVLSVNHRQIAATRNSGGRAAHGERLFFVDADTTISAGAVAAALRAMDKGAVGGGAPARFDAVAPLYARLLVLWLGLFMRLAGIAGGAFMFCTREAFDAAGGFDERLFGAEDAAFSLALKREGRFVVLWRSVVTSGRRMRGMRGPKMLGVLIRMAFFPKLLTRRSSVKKIWYESDREDADPRPDSLAVRAFNVMMLLGTLVLITPLFTFIPWSAMRRDSLLGEIRIGTGIFGCHVALICWPCAYFLFRNLLRQTRWLERARSTALIAACLWCAWGATGVVIDTWTWLGESLAHFHHA